MDAPFKKTSPEEQLVKLIIAKDKAALSRLYDKYSNVLNGEIFKIVSDETISSEILQDVFLKVWSEISSYKSENGRLFTWMLNISRKLAKDKLRFNDLYKENF